MGACFGAGMIAGPAIGGVLGDISVHAPFVAGALLNAIAFCLVAFLLPKTPSQPPEGQPAKINLFEGFRFNFAVQGLASFFALFFLMQLIGQAPAALWVIYGEQRLNWDIGTAGVSLAVFG